MKWEGDTDILIYRKKNILIVLQILDLLLLKNIQEDMLD